MKQIAVFVFLLIAGSGTASAQEKLRASDSRIIQDCIKGYEVQGAGAEACIGRVANICTAKDENSSTSGQAGCYRREQLVWDDILNETYRRLQESFDDRKKTGLRDVQRAWIEARKLQCGFYHDVIQGTLAIPISASCFNSETARRALYLLRLLDL